jgi:LysM domain
MRSIPQFLALSLLLAPFCACEAQSSKGDSTKVPLIVTEMLGDSLSNLLQTSDVIEAFHFKMANRNTVKDSTASSIFGFKVESKIPALSPKHIDSLRNIVFDVSTYAEDENVPKCGFNPDLGFKFKKGNKFLFLLVSTSKCNVLHFRAHHSKTPIARRCQVSESKFYELGKLLFPRSYPNIAPPAAPAVQEPILDTIPATDTLQEKRHPKFGGAAHLHKVTKNDTIKSISIKYHLTEQKFKILNPSIKKDKDLRKVETVKIQ